MAELSLEEKVRRLELLHKIGVALSAEQNKDRLVEMILLEAKALCNADGGTLYLRTDDEHLRFAILRNDTLGTALGGSGGRTVDLPAIPMYDPLTGEANRHNVATYAAALGRSVNVPDAYDAAGFDFSGTKKFDQRNNYRSKSFLTIPMVNNENRVIGVLQLINARDAAGNVIPFGTEEQRLVEALASQAGVALDNQHLLAGQKQLLESFIQMIASAIDHKSPYTGEHCERVPILTEMIARSVCQATDGQFKDFSLSEDEWYELKIAAWMHDCGKITTPVHVMDKATKLEAIFDRIELVRLRAELLRRDAQIDFLRRKLAGEANLEALEAAMQMEIETIDQDLQFLEVANVGGEFLEPERQQRIRELGARELEVGGKKQPFLSQDEVKNLSISRGTLSNEERLIINGHMVQTIKMLEALPFPRNLRRVPEYAGGHHEKMDGTGYPRGLYGGEMSIPARIMAIADVFEALTAQDRPYKKGKKLSEAMKIMGFMKRDNHLDPDLFDHFVSSRVYRQYAEKYLPTELIDEVDEAVLLAIQPKGYTLPDTSVRKARWHRFLAEYS
ncbi:MAG TPA: HD domain-containing phosphohydrolase [Polyangiaceae bacterium]|nr:HD domain-containing phosphohydrolase [Polyangiaceae bacterium]